jgi:cell division protein FtsB
VRSGQAAADAAAAPRRLPVRALTLAAVAVLLALLGVASYASWRELAVVRAEEAAVGRQVEDTRQRITVLERRIERLRNDPSTRERLAREELGMVRPGDVVIVLPADRPAPAAAAPEPAEPAPAPASAPAP